MGSPCSETSPSWRSRPQAVLERPDLHDLAVAQPEDGDLVDLLEAAPRGGMAKPVAEVGRRAGEAAHHRAALGDQLADLHVDVGEAGPEGGDPAPGRGSRPGGVQLVDDL